MRPSPYIISVDRGDYEFVKSVAATLPTVAYTREQQSAPVCSNCAAPW